MSFYSNTTTMMHQAALDNIPEGMRNTPRWMGTRFKEKPSGKVDKPPYRVRRGMEVQPGSKTDPEDLASFEEAVEALRRGDVHAIGYVLTEDDAFVVVDLDGVVDDHGNLAPEAIKLVTALDTYTEVSCSGRGLHAVMLGEKKTKKCRRGNVEIYDRSRFMVMTGVHVPDTPPEAQPRQDAIDALVAEHLAEHLAEDRCEHDRVAPHGRAGRRRPARETLLGDEELLNKARNAGGGMGEKFCRLHDEGAWSDYPSQSEADRALLRTYAFWTQHNRAAMARLFRQSALYRDKFERASYREPTIDSAIASQPHTYTGRPPRDGTGVRETVAAIRRTARHLSFTGRGGPSKWAVYMAALDYAEEFGRMNRGGVAVDLPERTAALGASVSERAARNALAALCEEGDVMKLLRKGKGTRGSRYLLKSGGSRVRNEGDCEEHCVPLSTTVRQIRNATPLTEKEFDKNGRKLSKGTAHLLQRLGKLRALILERVVASPAGISLDALSRNLDRKRSNLRRSLEKLLEAGLVVEGEDETYAIPSNLEDLLHTELAASGCDEARELAAKRFARERAAFKAFRAGGHPAGAAPSDDAMEARRHDRTLQALDVMLEPKTGPGMMTRTYLRGETKHFDYVVVAVTNYYRGGDPAVWRKPVEDAFTLITDGVAVDDGDLLQKRGGAVSPQPGPEPPRLSLLAVAIRAYLDDNPHDASQPAGWLANTLWTFDLYPHKASPADAKEAIAELGGEAYLREHLERAREGAA